jgi:hypothetical protein
VPRLQERKEAKKKKGEKSEKGVDKRTVVCYNT